MHPASARGRPPKFCKDHRTGAHGAPKDPAASKARARKRRTAKLEARDEALVARQQHDAARLAAGLLVLADPAAAARYVGLSVAGKELKELLELAKEHHQGVIDGDAGELGRRVKSTLFRIVGKIDEHLGEISPRDLPHAGQALARLSTEVVGKHPPPSFSEVSAIIIGAGGERFDPNSVPQPLGEDPAA